MSLINWPIQERPREKLVNQGAQSLSDAELLAIFLRTGTRGKSAIDLARDLIKEHGNLRNLLALNYQKISQIKGLGLAKYAQLQAALEMARRNLQEVLTRENILNNTQETQQFLLAKLRHYEREVFACLLLDSKLRMISFVELFFGGIADAMIYPREIIKCALQHNAAAIIFAHNHPSGVADPSAMDIELTRRLIKVLDSVDVRVVDHIIIGDGVVISLAEQGYL